jgi:hypothetical protein
MKHKRFNQLYPYSYLLIRKSDGMKYHGIRCHHIKLNKLPIEDLGNIYFSSGRLSEQFKRNPSDFIFKIKWTFDTWSEACKYENKVNSRIACKRGWANINSNGSVVSIKVMNKLREASVFEKYGVKTTLLEDNTRKKIKQSLLKRFGVDHPSKSDIIKNKKINTSLLKYGTKYAFQSEHVKNKIKKTMIKKYGVDNPQKCSKIKNKTSKTNLQKYGVKYTFQSKEVIDKIHKRRQEMYIRLAKMSDSEFQNYLYNVCKHVCTRNQKITQRNKGKELLCQPHCK